MTTTDWEGHYQRGETGWDRGHSSPALAHWLETGGLSPCRILIPGSGYGHEALDLARLGFDITAIDIADSPVRHLRQQLNEIKLHANVVQAEALELTALYESLYWGWNVKHFYSFYKREHDGARSYTWVKNKLQEKSLVKRQTPKEA